MPAQTKIQFRRGYSTGYNGPDIGGRVVNNANTWNTNTQLAEGEIGYEIDTGKFKIGKILAGSLLTWGQLSYAGGSELVASTGIGLIFNDQNNAYTLYSYITGIEGQQGVTFETLPLSGLLNNSNASGSYYRIGLSTKLENFHDSNIDISNNLISSSTSGITISGFNNSTIALNPDGGAVTQSGINIRNLTDSITATTGIGGIKIGDEFTTASGITSLLKKMLETIYEPLLNTLPNVTLTNGSYASRYVVGTAISNTSFSFSYDAGRINGTGLGPNWNSSAKQADAGGSLVKYLFTAPGQAETNVGLITSTGISYTIIEGDNNTFSLRGHYNAGPALVNSVGANYTSASLPLPSGFTAYKNLKSVGYWPTYYGTTTNNATIPSTSSEITSLSSVDVSSPYQVAGPYINDSSGLTIPSGTKKIIVAVPSGWAGFGSGISVTNEAGFSESENYNLTTIDVTINGVTKKYFVRYYLKSGGFDVATKHRITVT